MKKILVHPKAINEVKDRIIASGYEPLVTKDQTAATILKDARDVYGIIMMVDPFPNDMYDQMPNLKIIARFGVGYNNIDAPVAAEHGVWVTNTPGKNAVEVAESTVADMLILSKHLYTTTQKMREGDNTYPQTHPSHEISGKTIGIVGYGHIGQQVEKMVHGFTDNILIWNRSPRDPKYGKQVDWDTLFKESDYISLHLPAVKDTLGCVGPKEFEMMKDTAYLLNFARGPVVNEPAMIDALKTHQIAGAGLDVFDKEPLPMDSELRKLDNVFLTPHSSGDSVESWAGISNLALDNILAVLDGKQPLTPVNQVKK